MLSAYVEVLLCVIELLAFVAFKNTTAAMEQLAPFICQEFLEVEKLNLPVNWEKISTISDHATPKV